MSLTELMLRSLCGRLKDTREIWGYVAHREALGMCCGGASITLRDLWPDPLIWYIAGSRLFGFGSYLGNGDIAP